MIAGDLEVTPELRTPEPNANQLKRKDTDADLIYKLKIENLPKFAQKKQLINFLTPIIDPLAWKMKKAPDWRYCYLTFQNEEDAKSIETKLAGLDYKGNTLEVTFIKELQRSFSDRAPKKTTQESSETVELNPVEKLNNQVTPLWKESYETQLVTKTDYIVKIMRKLAKNLINIKKDRALARDKKNMLQWVDDFTRNNYNLLPIVPSPMVNYYRTKCEFSFGRNSKGEPTCGFLLGLFKNGQVQVESSDECLNVSIRAKEIAKSMEEYIRTGKGKDLPTFDRVERKGFWRVLQVRTQVNTNEDMVILQVDPTGVAASELATIKKDILAHFMSLPVPITTVLFQLNSESFNGISETNEIEILHGPGYINEVLLGMNFRISPFAFFQVNTPVAELIYARLKELVMEKDDKECLVLDVCCGTGTIGQLLAEVVGEVVGVDMVEGAINDAKLNASANGITNIEYLTDKVENVMNKIIREHVYAIKGSGNKAYYRQEPVAVEGPAEVKAESLENEEVSKKSIEEVKDMTTEEAVKVESSAAAELEAVAVASVTPKEPTAEATKEMQVDSTAIEKPKYTPPTSDKNVIAILDPARAGVHSSVIKSLRECAECKTILYVSCDAELAMTNFEQLCRPTSLRFPGVPFKIGRVQGYDLFPHCKGSEVILEFTR